VSNHHKNTKSSFFETMTELWEAKNEKGFHSPILSIEIWNVILYYQTELNRMIVDDRDYLFYYFGLKTLERAYLFKVNNKIVEKSQLEEALLNGSLPKILKESLKKYIDSYEQYINRYCSIVYEKFSEIKWDVDAHNLIKEIYDMSSSIGKGVFSPMKDPAKFNQVHIGE
jgi:hypothetical protein